MIKADYDKRGILFPIRIFSTDDMSFCRKEFDNVNGNIQLGPFKIEFVTLTHYILEPNGLSIETPSGTV